MRVHSLKGSACSVDIPNRLGLTPGIRYRVRVRATIGDVAGDWSNERARVAQAAPATPGQVTGVQVTPEKRQSSVTWVPVTGTEGYKVQWIWGGKTFNNPSKREVPTSVCSGNTCSYTIMDLEERTLYTVRVIATKEFAEPPDGPSSGYTTANAMGRPHGEPGVILLSASGEAITELTVHEGDTVEYTVVLGAPDTGNVMVTPTKTAPSNTPNSDANAIQIAGTALTFTTDNWHVPQTVAVR